MEKPTTDDQKILEQPKARGGRTVVTSVSIQKDFKELMDTYSIPPTDAMRRGVAVSLYDLGVLKYLTPLNERRSIALKKFFEAMKDDEKELEEHTKQFRAMIEASKTILKIAKTLGMEK
jgi:hypothetical protein|tara:strand:+ start:3963 stop:4319 length:357 start_codon:yes stop_codon:yes gene_type:complete